MTDRFLTSNYDLDEQAWAHMCALAARAASRESCGSATSARAHYSIAIGRMLAQLPPDLLGRAVTLAKQYCQLDCPDELSADHAATNPSAQDAPSTDAALQHLDLSTQDGRRLHMLEGASFPLHGAAIDAAHGGPMTRTMALGMIKLWCYSGQDALLACAQQSPSTARSTYLVVIRSPRRLFCSDYQLELTVSPEGATYASNVLLQTEEGAALLPNALPRTFGPWLLAVLHGFSAAARAMELLREPLPLADSSYWAQIQAALRRPPNTPRS